MTRRILIGSPVRQSPAKLRPFLDGLARLETDGLELVHCFVDDNDDPESSALLDAFLADTPGMRVRLEDRPEPYVRDDQTHRWRRSLIERVASIKNYLLALARDGGFDAVLLVDSDLVLHPRTLAHLVALDKPVVSEVFWTRWEPGAPFMPQTWLTDHYTMYRAEPDEVLTPVQVERRIRDFLHRMRDGGCHPVGGLGACTLIARRALMSGVNFDLIHNISFWGEDRAFCIRAAALGIDLWADTRYPPLHLYRDADLARVSSFWRRVARGFESKPHVTLTMAIGGESTDDVQSTLAHHRTLIDHANLVVDGGRLIETAAIRRALDGVSHSIFRLDQPIGSDRYVLRRLAWELTEKDDPDWVLLLDPGERLDDAACAAVQSLLRVPGAQVVHLPLLRPGAATESSAAYVTALTRFSPYFAYQWNETINDDRRLPDSVAELPQKCVWTLGGNDVTRKAAVQAGRTSGRPEAVL
ncbi:MAG: hypothetical protein N3D71_03125 [Burkholderiaceae bacterium]|nr:hypothetical protein [Burkholderiaceae bacterium]